MRFRAPVKEPFGLSFRQDCQSGGLLNSLAANPEFLASTRFPRIYSAGVSALPRQSWSASSRQSPHTTLDARQVACVESGAVVQANRSLVVLSVVLETYA